MTQSTCYARPSSPRCRAEFQYNPQSFVLTKTMIPLPQNNLTQVALAFPQKGHTDLVHGPQVCQVDATKNTLACKSCRLSLIVDNSLVKTQSLPFPPFGVHSDGIVR